MTKRTYMVVQKDTGMVFRSYDELYEARCYLTFLSHWNQELDPCDLMVIERIETPVYPTQYRYHYVPPPIEHQEWEEMYGFTQTFTQALEADLITPQDFMPQDAAKNRGRA